MRVSIKSWDGKIIGFVETDSEGNKVVRDFYLNIVSRYDAKQNVTRDFYGKIVGKGDLTMVELGKKMR